MCKICDSDPKAHSFFKIATERNTQIFYSCPAEATRYWDTDGIVNHCNEKLAEKGDADWIYTFDGKGFGLKHALEIGAALGLLGVLKNHEDTLKEIRMINTSLHVKTMMKTVQPFISKSISKKIVWKS